MIIKTQNTMKKFLAILAMAASFLAVSCQKNNGDDDDDNKQEETKGLGIKIDGAFDDWATLKSDVVFSAKNNADSPWDAVAEIRCCADKDFVYYYIRYNATAAKEQLADNDALNIRLCLNTDGEFTTGYQKYFLDFYDFIIEGPLADGAGKWTAFDGTLHQHSGGTASADFHELLKPNNNLVMGKGAGSEYEILLAREIFNNAVPAGHKIGDTFYTGIRFYYAGWNEFSNMPNASVADGDGSGWGHLMKVTTAK